MNSCKKDISSPGLNLLNSENNAFGSVDTFALKVGSIKVDSLISSNPSYLMLGSYVDPVFSKYDAGFYAQAIISSLKPDFGDSIIVDSLVLGMRFSGVYGKLDEQNFEVYELSEDLIATKSYNTKSYITVKSDNLVLKGKITPKPQGYKFTDFLNDTIRDNIRLQLDTSLAYRFIKDSKNSSDNFATMAKFLTYFKGLHVKVSNSNQQSGEGGVMYFDSPVLTIYYSCLPVGKSDRVAKKFSFELKGGVRFNHVACNYTGTNVEKLVLGQVTDQKDFYAQANHVRGTVNLPTIKDIPNNSIIHYAKLILPVDYSSKDIYSYGSEIFVSIRNSSTDQTLRYLTSGELDTAYNGYVIDVRDHIQRVITGKRLNHPLVVSPKFFNSSAERIHFLGPKTLGMDKPRLLIKYSTF